jgi:hypothetical protein
MTQTQLVACLSVACLALMAALMIAGGTPLLALALLSVGGLVTMSACLIADLQC